MEGAEIMERMKLAALLFRGGERESACEDCSIGELLRCRGGLQVDFSASLQQMFSLIQPLHCSNAPFPSPEWTLIHGVASIANNTSTRGQQTTHHANLAINLDPQPNLCTTHPISDPQPECRCDPTIPRFLWLPTRTRTRTRPRPLADYRVFATLLTASKRVNG